MDPTRRDAALPAPSSSGESGAGAAAGTRSDGNGARGRAQASEPGLAEELKAAVAREVEAGHDYAGILTRLSRLLDRYAADARGRAESPPAAPAWPAWARFACTRRGHDGRELTVVGPGHADRVDVGASSAEEAARIADYVASIDELCQRMVALDSAAQRVLGERADLEQARASISEPPHATVRNHIRLLHEYNEVKDVGQQLIGLVAENRGVPIGVLYRDGSFGVGPDD